MILKKIVAQQRGLTIPDETKKSSESSDSLGVDAEGLEDPMDKSPDPPGFRREDPFEDDNEELCFCHTADLNHMLSLVQDPPAPMSDLKASYMDVMETLPMNPEDWGWISTYFKPCYLFTCRRDRLKTMWKSAPLMMRQLGESLLWWGGEIQFLKPRPKKKEPFQNLLLVMVKMQSLLRR